MLTRRRSKRWLALGVGAVLAGVLAGGVVAGQFGWSSDPESLVQAVEGEPMVKVATIGSADSLQGRAVFVQATSTGQFCLWDAPASGGSDRRGGCNSIDDPLGGAQLSASLSYDGGPETTRVTEARLIGLVSLKVGSVQVVMSDGTRRVVPMSRGPAVASSAGRFRAFGYRFSPSDFKRGVGPAVILALDTNGREIDRQTTGFGG